LNDTPNIPARVSVITLGAVDLAKLRAFYRRLGWREAADYPEFAMFDTGGALLALFPFGSLAADAHVAAGVRPQGYRGFAIALNVETRDAVDSTVQALRAAGATITKEPEDAVWGGRSAYFVDPEHNLWEVAWNPAVDFDARGAIVPRTA
jgi:catechol 2,3-dioxygenase-like lactoylglutathione lyase family enzyme